MRGDARECHKLMTNPDSIESYDQAHDVAAGGEGGEECGIGTHLSIWKLSATSAREPTA